MAAELPAASDDAPEATTTRAWHSWRILVTGHYLHLWEAEDRFHWAITDTVRREILRGPTKGYTTFTHAKDGATTAFNRHRDRLVADHPVPCTRRDW